MATSLGEEKLYSNLLNSALIWPCVTSCSYGGAGKYIHMTAEK